MVSIGGISTGKMIAFGIAVLTIGLGVAFAPEIKASVLGIKRKVAR